MIRDVQFEEPENLVITPRTFIEREPGVLSRRLMRIGLVRNVTQAKIAIAVTLMSTFLASAYFLEAALSEPDIPPLPPSPAYQEFIQERLEKNG